MGAVLQRGPSLQQPTRFEDPEWLAEVFTGPVAARLSTNSRQVSRNPEDDTLYTELPCVYGQGPVQICPREWDQDTRMKALSRYGTSTAQKTVSFASDALRRIRRLAACIESTRPARALRCAVDRAGLAWSSLTGLILAGQMAESHALLAAILVVLVVIPYVLLAILLWPSSQTRITERVRLLSRRLWWPEFWYKVLNFFVVLGWAFAAPLFFGSLDVYICIRFAFTEPKAIWLYHYLTLRQLVGALGPCILQAFFLFFLLLYQFDPHDFVERLLLPKDSFADDWLLILGASGCAIEAIYGRLFVSWAARLQSSGSAKALLTTLRLVVPTDSVASGKNIGLAPAALLKAILRRSEVVCQWDLSSVSLAGLRSISDAVATASETLEALSFTDTTFLERLHKTSPRGVESALARIVTSGEALQRFEMQGPWPNKSNKDVTSSLVRVLQKRPRLEGIVLPGGAILQNDFLCRISEVSPLLRAVWLQDTVAIDFLVGPQRNKTIAGQLVIAEQFRSTEPFGGESALHLAARRGSTDVLRILLLSAELAEFPEGRNPLHLRDFSGFMPLHRAAATGHTRCTEMLLLAAASPNECSAGVISFLGQSGRCAAKVTRMATRAADPAWATHKVEYINGGIGWICLGEQEGRVRNDEHAMDVPFQAKGWTPLLQAAAAGRSRVCGVLTTYGAAPDLSSLCQGQYSEWTPLLVAALQGCEKTCKVLLAAGAGINTAKDDGATPLLVASQQGHLAVCKVLRAWYAEVDATMNDGTTPLIVAAQRGHWTVCEALLHWGAGPNLASTDGTVPLFVAAQSGHAATCEVLIRRGANVNARHYTGSPPLYVAAQQGHIGVCEVMLPWGLNLAKEVLGAPLLIASQKGRSEICRLLVSRAADINTCTPDGTTPMYLAAQEGHSATCEVLANLGAQSDKVRQCGMTPLLIASQKGHAQVCELLLGRNACANVQAKNGATALLSATRMGCLSICAELVKHNANPNTVGSISGGSSFPLLLAAQMGEFEICKLLLAYKAVVNTSDSVGQTPLSVATQEQHAKMAELLLNNSADLATAARTLSIASGIGSERAWGEGWAPLHVAALQGNTLLCELLILRSADVNARRRDGATPLVVAAGAGHLDLCMKLIENGANPDLEVCKRLASKGVDLDLSICRRLAWPRVVQAPAPGSQQQPHSPRLQGQSPPRSPRGGMAALWATAISPSERGHPVIMEL